LGAALISLFLVGEAIEGLVTQRSLHTIRLGALSASLIGCLALVPLNPNGVTMFSYPLETIRSKAMQTYIAEWASPNFHNSEYVPFLALLLASIIALAWARDRIRWRDLLLLVVSAVAALTSIRMIPLFVLVAVPWLARSIPIRIKPKQETSSRGTTSLLGNAAILVAMVTFVAIHTGQVIRQQRLAEAATFPAEAVAYLQAHPSAGPIFNSYDWGGYLIWQLYPATRVFIDGRADLYGPQHLEQFADTYQLRANWLKTLDEWKIETTVLPADCALASGLRQIGGWRIIHEDRQAVIFRRSTN
jgi:hypothetical protein